MLRFKKPCTALYFSMSPPHSASPTSCATCAGALRAALTNGKTTSVMSPSNSARVFWNCTCAGVISTPYKFLTTSCTRGMSISSNVIYYNALHFSFKNSASLTDSIGAISA